MVKLKVISRFLYAVDRNIYDVGDEIIVSDQEEAKYFIEHKLAEAHKEAKAETKEVKVPKAKK